MTNSSVTLFLEVSSRLEVDDLELAELSGQLRRELLELDVDAVELKSSGETPTGAKGSGSDVVNLLIVTLSNSTVLAALAGTLGSWVRRSTGRMIKVTYGENSLEVGQASAEDQARLIEAWIDSLPKK